MWRSLHHPSKPLIALFWLAVIAMKVVHPGGSGQAVGCDTHRLDWRIASDEHSQECALDTAKSTLAGVAD